jgi:hypothetical protein
LFLLAGFVGCLDPFFPSPFGAFRIFVLRLRGSENRRRARKVCRWFPPFDCLGFLLAESHPVVWPHVSMNKNLSQLKDHGPRPPPPDAKEVRQQSLESSAGHDIGTYCDPDDISTHHRQQSQRTRGTLWVPGTQVSNLAIRKRGMEVHKRGIWVFLICVFVCI